MEEMERKINYNVSGRERRELVSKIAEITGEHPVYMGMPSIAFKIGPFEVNRLGVLTWEEWADNDAHHLIDQLKEAGYSAAEDTPVDNIDAISTETSVDTEEPEAEAPAEEPEEGDEMEDQPITISISVPDHLTEEEFSRLQQLVNGKATLLKHAFGAEDLPIVREEGQIAFPWFTASDGDHTAAYSIFLVKLIELAKNSKRVTTKDKDVENERYAFRCFLLRLGFIGDEYKGARKVLQENLTGSSAFKSGHRAAAAETSTEETAAEAV